MKILVINAGSSSLKYQLIDMDNEQMVCKGNCERIGMPGGIFTHKTADGRELQEEREHAGPRRRLYAGEKRPYRRGVRRYQQPG